MKFGIVEIEPEWIAMKILILGLSWTLSVMVPVFYWLGAAIFLYFGIGAFHEFFHAFIVLRNKGEIHKIFLGYPNTYIDYKVPTLKNECKVFFGGALLEFFVMFIVGYTLSYGFKATGNLGYAIILICWIWLFVTSEILPIQSDIMQYTLCQIKLQKQG